MLKIGNSKIEEKCLAILKTINGLSYKDLSGTAPTEGMPLQLNMDLYDGSSIKILTDDMGSDIKNCNNLQKISTMTEILLTQAWIQQSQVLYISTKELEDVLGFTDHPMRMDKFFVSLFNTKLIMRNSDGKVTASIRIRQGDITNKSRNREICFIVSCSPLFPIFKMEESGDGYDLDTHKKDRKTKLAAGWVKPNKDEKESGVIDNSKNKIRLIGINTAQPFYTSKHRLSHTETNILHFINSQFNKNAIEYDSNFFDKLEEPCVALQGKITTAIGWTLDNRKTGGLHYKLNQSGNSKIIRESDKICKMLGGRLGIQLGKKWIDIGNIRNRNMENAKLFYFVPKGYRNRIESSLGYKNTTESEAIPSDMSNDSKVVLPTNQPCIADKPIDSVVPGSLCNRDRSPLMHVMHINANGDGSLLRIAIANFKFSNYQGKTILTPPFSIGAPKAATAALIAPRSIPLGTLGRFANSRTLLALSPSESLVTVRESTVRVIDVIFSDRTSSTRCSNG